MSASFFSVRFSSLLTLNNRSASSRSTLPVSSYVSNRSASFFSLPFHVILLLATGLYHSSLYSSHLILPLATGLHHFRSTLLISSYPKQHVSLFFTLLFSSHPTFSNNPVSSFLYSSCLVLLLATDLCHSSLYSSCLI